jgi:uncharacterized coiled-coil DUF342 family protein
MVDESREEKVEKSLSLNMTVRRKQMPKNRMFLLSMMLCAVITLSACDKWDDATKIFRYKGLYEETLTELAKIKSQLAATKKEVKQCNDKLKQIVVEADEYKDNLNQAAARADEYKDKWEAIQTTAEKANEKVLGLQNDLKELEKRLGSAIIENKKANLMIIGLKMQVEQCADTEEEKED